MLIKKGRFLPDRSVLCVACGVMASLVFSGCSSGSGTSPVASPTPTPAPVVTAQRSEYPDSVPSRAEVKVQWSLPTFTPVANVVEYHVYRNNVVQYAVQRNRTFYYDAVGESFGGTGISYYEIDKSDKTKLTRIENVPVNGGVEYGTPVTYRVTALHKTNETASSAAPEYAETEIGTSNMFTPEQ